MLSHKVYTVLSHKATVITIKLSLVSLLWLHTCFFWAIYKYPTKAWDAGDTTDLKWRHVHILTQLTLTLQHRARWEQHLNETSWQRKVITFFKSKTHHSHYPCWRGLKGAISPLPNTRRKCQDLCHYQKEKKVPHSEDAC